MGTIPGMRLSLAVATLGCLSAMQAPALPALAGTATDVAAIDAHVRAAMDASGVPAVSYAIARDGVVIHVGAFGLAGPGGVPMTGRTPLVLGSVGKSMTALAIRQLQQAGRLGLDMPVVRYLPWFALGGGTGVADRITVRQLLQHTSGLSTADGQNPRWYAPGLSVEGIVRSLAGVTPTGVPGSYAYSNLNYVILGALIEAVSGESYGAYLRAHVFAPLGMVDSFTSLADAQGDGLAAGHRVLFGVTVPYDEPYPTGMVPAGYQIASADDMGRFVAALANQGITAGSDIATATGNAVRQPPQPAAPDYGTDWQPLLGAGAGTWSGQSGSTLTTNADILVAPVEHVGVAVLMTANPTQVMNLPAGASDVALDVLRLTLGLAPSSTPPTVRTLYLAIDGLLLVLLALLAVHAARARSWRDRLRTGAHSRLLLARTVVADALLPLGVLLGLPLAIGATGSTHPGDGVGGWRFLLWTLPDLAASLALLAVVGMMLGIAKLLALTGLTRPGRMRRAA